MNSVPPEEQLPRDEVLYVMEQARGPLSTREVLEQLGESGMQVYLREVRLTLGALAADRQVIEKQDGTWIIQAAARPNR